MGKKRAKIGRPPAEPPRGYLTIQQVADELGVSYSTVYRLREVADPVEHDDMSGVVLIPRRNVAKIEAALRPSSTADKRGIFLRPDSTRVERWGRAIARQTPRGEAPQTVAQWLAKLADDAADRVLG